MKRKKITGINILYIIVTVVVVIGEFRTKPNKTLTLNICGENPS